MSLTGRHIDVEFQLLDGGTFNGTDNTATIRGLRCSAVIQKNGGTSPTQLTLKIYGMPLNTGASMNKLTILGKSMYEVRRNIVSVYAYNTGQTPALVFTGTIQYAWADLNSQPDAVFNVTGIGQGVASVAPSPPASFPQDVDVAVMMQGFANQLGLPLENNGVTAKLPPSYFSGSLVPQIQTAAQAAQINYLIDDKALAIWPNDGYRDGNPALISKETGMISYPIWTQAGMSIRTLFNPNVVCGGRIIVQSDITPACGLWYSYSLTHSLDAEMPGGQWMTQIECSVIGRPIPIV